jgi:hypothetical protein
MKPVRGISTTLALVYFDLATNFQINGNRSQAIANDERTKPFCLKWLWVDLIESRISGTNNEATNDSKSHPELDAIVQIISLVA